MRHATAATSAAPLPLPSSDSISWYCNEHTPVWTCRARAHLQVAVAQQFVDLLIEQLFEGRMEAVHAAVDTDRHERLVNAPH